MNAPDDAYSSHENPAYEQEYANQHIAIMKIEKMCLLGNDLPFVLLCMSGSISSASYGRGAS